MLLLPPNTSHFLQPLDDLVFAIYKSHLAKLALELLEALRGTGTKRSPAQIITGVTAAAESIAFAPDNIRESFRKCGMWPIDYAKIEEMAYLNIGKPVDSQSPQVSPRKATRDHCRKGYAAVVMELNLKKEYTRDRSEKANLRVTPTVEYATLFDTDSIIAKSEEAKAGKEMALSVKAERDREKALEKVRTDALKDERRVEKERRLEEKEQKLREKVNIDEAKRLRGVGVKRKRADPPDLELSCIVKDCKLTWNSGDSSTWMFCDHCDACCVCQVHWRVSSGRSVLKEHETRCPHRPRKKQKVDEPAVRVQ